MLNEQSVKKGNNPPNIIVKNMVMNINVFLKSSSFSESNPIKVAVPVASNSMNAKTPLLSPLI